MFYGKNPAIKDPKDRRGRKNDLGFKGEGYAKGEKRLLTNLYHDGKEK